MNEIVVKFEEDFRKYLNNEINHFKLFGRALDSEDEIRWLKQYLERIVTGVRVDLEILKRVLPQEVGFEISPIIEKYSLTIPATVPEGELPSDE